MKRILCLLLSVIFLLSLGVFPAFAASEEASGESSGEISAEEGASEEAASAEAETEEQEIEFREPVSLEIDGLFFTVPAGFLDESGQQTSGVVNGYYTDTAPILLIEGESEYAAELAQFGYVVVEATALDEAVSYIAENDDDLPGDAGRLILVGGTAAAELAAVSGSTAYAAILLDPLVTAEADEAAVTAELEESFDDMTMDLATVSITESSNSTTIDEDAKSEVEANYSGSAEISWSESSSEPYVSETSISTIPNDWGTADTAVAIEVTSPVAYAFITWDLKNEGGSYKAAYGLAEDFREAGSTVNFRYFWESPSETGYDIDAFALWIDRICKYEADFTSEEIEVTLNLANALATGDAEWTKKGSYYVLTSDRYIGVVDVAKPELPDYQGVSVAVPAAYVNGINEDGTLDINWEAEITNSNGMTYTAATAPIVMQTGATGYSVKLNYTASTGSSTGYITVEPGNRGKYSQAYDAEGHHYYTGDAPLCTTDQKSTVRWLRYNNSLGLIPGDIDRIVTWGGSGGGAHSTLICAGDSPYYAEYLYRNGALGVECVNGEYTYTEGFSDAIWGSCPGGAVTNLEEANMLYEFETWLSSPTDEVLLTLEDGTPVYVPQNISSYSPFYKLLSYYMVMQFVEYFNAENLTYDIDGDGNAEALEILYDPAGHPETNGFYGSYLDFFLDSAEAQLEWAMNNIEAASYTFANENGESDVEAFLNGHYTYVASGGGPDVPTGEQQGTDLMSCLVQDYSLNEDGSYEVHYQSICAWEDYRGRSKTPLAFDSMDYCTENEEFGDAESDYRHWDKYCLAAMTEHYDELEAAYQLNETQYETFAELYEDFANDCIEIVLGQEFSGQVTEENIQAVLDTRVGQEAYGTIHDAVWMYNPMRLFLDGTATLPTWVWTVTGAADSDSSNLVSMNDAIALSMNGTDASFAWTWGAGHGSNTPLNTSQNGTIDAMMAKYPNT